ncbi:MAG: pyridoxal-phosphate-dependent aminotransferase family protein [Candidatus Njordarchaeales archaeon]
MSEFRIYDEENTLLMIPGPVPVHPRVLRALAKPIYGHRTSEFRSLLEEIEKMLKPLFGTKGPVFMLTGSGTAGMDAAIRSFVKPGDKVVSLIAGKFSKRFAEIAKTAGAKVIEVNVEWGRAIKPDIVEKALKSNPDAKVVTMTHNETSTGVLQPAPEIAKVVKDYGALLIVDGITSVGGDYVKMDEWGLDVVVAGSQKCIGIPPGLAFVAIREELIDELEKNNGRLAYYLDLKRYWDTWKKQGDLPFTGAVSLFYALYESLRIIHEEGLENRIKRHRLMAKMTRAGFEALGLELFPEKGFESNTLTAVKYPPGISDKEFRSRMREHGILVAGGQAHLKGKIFRVSHMNLIAEREVLTVLGIAELVLKEFDFPVKESGVRAAIEVYLKEGGRK